jgi:hypothetical protein
MTTSIPIWRKPWVLGTLGGFALLAIGSSQSSSAVWMAAGGLALVLGWGLQGVSDALAMAWAKESVAAQKKQVEDRLADAEGALKSHEVLATTLADSVAKSVADAVSNSVSHAVSSSVAAGVEKAIASLATQVSAPFERAASRWSEAATSQEKMTGDWKAAQDSWTQNLQTAFQSRIEEWSAEMRKTASQSASQVAEQMKTLSDQSRQAGEVFTTGQNEWLQQGQRLSQALQETVESLREAASGERERSEGIWRSGLEATQEVATAMMRSSAPVFGDATTDTMSICPGLRAFLVFATSSRHTPGAMEGMPKQTAELTRVGSEGGRSMT